MPVYTFKRVQLNRLLLFKNTLLPLCNQGLVLVRGSYEGNNGSKNSNESGKSLLFSSIPLLSQGQMPTGKMSKKTSSPIDISMNLSINKKSYSIGLNGNKYSITQDKKGITPHRKPDTIKLIQGLFPDEALFNSISFVSQFSPIYANLISGTAGLRLKVIEDFLDQTKIQTWKDRIKERTNKFVISVREGEDLELEIKTYSKELKTLPKVNKKSIQDLILRKRKLKEQISALREILNGLRTAKDNAIKYAQLRKRLKLRGKKPLKIRSEIKRLKVLIEDKSTIISTIEDCREDLDKYIELGKPDFPKLEALIPPEVTATEPKLIEEEKLVELMDEYKLAFFDRSLLVQSRGKLRGLAGKKKCPTCGKKLNDLETQKLYAAQTKRITQYDKQIRTLKFKLGPAKAVQDLFYNLEGMGEDVLSAYESEGLKRLRTKLKNNKKRLSFLENQLPIIEALKQLKMPKSVPDQNKIDKLSKRIDDLEEDLEEVIKILEVKKENFNRRKRLENKLKDLLSRQKEAKVNKDDKIYLPIVAKVFSSRDLKTEIAMDFCEGLTSEWNVFASQLFTRSIKFGVDIEQGYPAFQFCHKNSSPADIRHLSGGAKKRLIACMIPSLLKIAPSPTNILVVDELDANLDESGVEAILEFFEYLGESSLGKDSIFFLSARTKITHSSYSNWLVKREGNESKLIRE